ncbi:unnamed protein product, partial [Vitis vinifera]
MAYKAYCKTQVKHLQRYKLLHFFLKCIKSGNVNMLMDPLIHLGPLRLRIAGIVTLVMDKFGHLTFEGKRKKDIYMFLILSFTFAILFFLITASH